MAQSLGFQAYSSSQRLWRRVFTLLVRRSFQTFGPGSTLCTPIKLEGVEHISIGCDVYIGPNSWLSFLEKSRTTESGGIVIGDSMNIAGECVLSSVQQIVLEDNVLIVRSVHLSDHTHRFEETDRPIVAQGVAKVAPVLVKSGAWIGQGVVVCPGVTIGKNAVVGANSVVRVDVPDFCLAAGAPATVRRRVAQPKVS